MSCTLIKLHCMTYWCHATQLLQRSRTSWWLIKHYIAYMIVMYLNNCIRHTLNSDSKRSRHCDTSFGKTRCNALKTTGHPACRVYYVALYANHTQKDICKYTWVLMHKAAAASSMNTHDRAAFRNRVMTEAAEEGCATQSWYRWSFWPRWNHQQSFVSCICQKPEAYETTSHQTADSDCQKNALK